MEIHNKHNKKSKNKRKSEIDTHDLMMKDQTIKQVNKFTYPKEYPNLIGGTDICFRNKVGLFHLHKNSMITNTKLSTTILLTQVGEFHSLNPNHFISYYLFDITYDYKTNTMSVDKCIHCCSCGNLEEISYNGKYDEYFHKILLTQEMEKHGDFDEDYLKTLLTKTWGWGNKDKERFFIYPRPEMVSGNDTQKRVIH